MKLFKNYKTKRQLREENAKLQGMLSPYRQPFITVERDIQKVSHAMICENEIPTEYIKKQIARGIADYLEPIIEWDIEDDISDPRRKNIRGTLYVAKRKGDKLCD